MKATTTIAFHSALFLVGLLTAKECGAQEQEPECFNSTMDIFRAQQTGSRPNGEYIICPNTNIKMYVFLLRVPARRRILYSGVIHLLVVGLLGVHSSVMAP